MISDAEFLRAMGSRMRDHGFVECKHAYGTVHVAVVVVTAADLDRLIKLAAGSPSTDRSVRKK